MVQCISNNSVTLRRRLVAGVHMSSGWFNASEPVRTTVQHRKRGMWVSFQMSSGWFNPTEALRTAMTITERAIARSVDCECPISAATSDLSAVRAIAFNSLPCTDASRLVPCLVRFAAQIRECRSLHLIRALIGPMTMMSSINF